LPRALFFLAPRYCAGQPTIPSIFSTGSDQLLLFGPRYAIPELALLIFILCALASAFFARQWGKLSWAQLAIPLQLYVIVGLAVILHPTAFVFRSSPPRLRY